MMCPKCKARIGMISEQVATDTGRGSGNLCYMCGYWLQHYPNQPNAIGSAASR